MTPLFLKISELSTTASFLIVAVVVLRVVLKKAPKGMRYVLWAMVGLRLLVPFTLESPFSVLPSQKEISTAIAPNVNTTAVSSAQAVQPVETNSVDITAILSCVWIAGVVVMLLYMVVSFVKVHLMVRESVLYKDNVYLCDHVSSPFVLGIIKPKIYLNSSMSKKDAKLIIAHERTHIRHMDNLWKPLGYVLLAVYWFNPLCWVSYFLFVKDIELFCDETVVKTLSKKGKKNYSYALLSCSTGKNMVTACPLAFAENSVKTRIKNILGYKKPALYIMVIATVLCVATMLMFMTTPVSAKEVEEKTDVAKATNTVMETVFETTAPTVAQTEVETQAPTEITTQTQQELQNNSQIDTSQESQQSVTPPEQEDDFSDRFIDDEIDNSDNSEELDINQIKEDVYNGSKNAVTLDPHRNNTLYKED